MGLYINKLQHPEVYENLDTIESTNQTIVKKDSLSELIDEQQKANVSLIKSLDELKYRFLEQEGVQANHWDVISAKLNELKNNDQTHKELEIEVIQWLKILDEQYNKLHEANQQLSTQLNEQGKWQQQLSEELNKQEAFQTGVLSRLDKQEALTEKISRQLNHIRSILFERTNYLADKIDEGYKLTSSYVYNLMTGSDQPLAFYLLNRREEKSK